MKTVGYLVASGVAALAVAAGPALAAGAAAAPAATGTTAAGHQHRAPVPIGRGRVLTGADGGRTVRARPGETVTVRLYGRRAHGVTFAWSAPRSGDSAVLRQTDGVRHRPATPAAGSAPATAARPCSARGAPAAPAAGTSARTSSSRGG